MDIFDEILNGIIRDFFLIQGKDTPYLNEKTVQLKFAIELYKRLGIEVELEKCFNPNDDKRDYLDIFYKEKKIGIELKYKLKSFDGYPFKNQAAQNIGAYAFFVDIHRLENLVYQGDLNEGYAVFITNDKTYTQNRRGSIKDFSLTAENNINKGYNYITHHMEPVTHCVFQQSYSPFKWQFDAQNYPEKCNFYACVQKVVKGE